MKAVSGLHSLGLACAVIFVGSLNTIYQGSAPGIGSHAHGLPAKAPPSLSFSPFSMPPPPISMAYLQDRGPRMARSSRETPVLLAPFHPQISDLKSQILPALSMASPRPTPAEAAAETRRAELGDLIAQCERDYGVDRHLITAVIKVESNFNPGAVSPEGAQGLMQLMPDMAQEVGITDRLDPVQNVTGGAIYLARQLQEFQGDLPLALAAYNAGPSAVRKHGGIPPYQVTRNFVDKVIYYQRHFKRGSNAIPEATE